MFLVSLYIRWTYRTECARVRNFSFKPELFLLGLVRHRSADGKPNVSDEIEFAKPFCGELEECKSALNLSRNGRLGSSSDNLSGKVVLLNTCNVRSACVCIATRKQSQWHLDKAVQRKPHATLVGGKIGNNYMEANRFMNHAQAVTVSVFERQKWWKRENTLFRIVLKLWIAKICRKYGRLTTALLWIKSMLPYLRIVYGDNESQ